MSPLALFSPSRLRPVAAILLAGGCLLFAKPPAASNAFISLLNIHKDQALVLEGQSDELLKAAAPGDQVSLAAAGAMLAGLRRSLVYEAHLAALELAPEMAAAPNCKAKVQALRDQTRALLLEDLDKLSRFAKHARGDWKPGDPLKALFTDILTSVEALQQDLTGVKDEPGVKSAAPPAGKPAATPALGKKG